MQPPRSRALRRRLVAVPCLLLALLAGCARQELYSQLSERQANEMIAVLQGVGIDAEKQGKDGRFAVLTAGGHFAQAVRTLSAQGYPRESYDSMGQVFKKEGFVSSPLEERARLVHAMSQEISNTIASIDGVVTARVHLVVPERHPLLDKVQPASAAVFIKHRPDKDLGGQVTQIKALVVNSLEGLSYDNVTVALFPAEAAATEPARASAEPAPAPGHQATLTPLLLGSLAGTFALTGGGLLWWRRRGAAALPAPATPAALARPAAEPPRDAAAFEARLQRLQRTP